MKSSLSLLVEMGKFWLRLLVHVKDEWLAAEILIKGVHSVESVGHVDEEGRVVGFVVPELAGRVGQHVEGSMLVNLAEGGAEASFLVLGR